MIPNPPGSDSRAASRRNSLLLASGFTRMAVALGGAAVIWLGTGWAMGWW